MAKKDLASKVAKYLRRANRLKSLQMKLDHLNELIDDLRRAEDVASEDSGDELSDGIEENWLHDYIELCCIHKLKFQLDALLEEVKRDLAVLERDPKALPPESVNGMIHRLHVALEIDPDYQEARALQQALQSEGILFPDPRALAASLNIEGYQAPKLCLEIICERSDIENSEALQEQYQTYRLRKAKGNGESQTCRLRFYEKHLPIFERFHEELRTKSSYTILVNGVTLKETIFSEWLQCYKRFLRAQNPQYCYGGSSFTFNVWGCHKLDLKDVATDLEACWFQHGTFDEASGIFLVSQEELVKRVQARLPGCGFCPALHQDKLLVGLASLPAYINPEIDPRWTYLLAQGQKIGVLPVGESLAITAQRPDFEGREEQIVVEVGATPYIQTVLEYLHSQDEAVFAESAYKGLSRCMVCGAFYKPYTMKCSQCKVEFWKYALKDLRAVLARLRYTRRIALKDLKNRLQDAPDPEADNEEPEEANVSFAHLWDDPQIRKMLMTDEEAEGEDLTSSTPAETAPAEPPSLPDPPAPSDQLYLHERLRGLVSKKYRERKAIERAFWQEQQEPADSQTRPKKSLTQRLREMSQEPPENAHPDVQPSPPSPPNSKPVSSSSQAELMEAVKRLKPRQKSELSKRGVVRVIYHATMDKETCPLCAYLDGMVMDPDDPATDIFSPPLYPGCTCRREYILKTEKPKNWPDVTFRFPPKELLEYLDKEYV